MITLPKVTIELSYPVKIDGIETSVLQMRRPKVSDQLLMSKKRDKSDEEREVELFADLCEISPEDIGALDMMDYGKVQKQYSAFLAPDSPEETSEESAQN